VIRHATDESEAACVAGDLVRTSGIVELIRGLGDSRVAFLEIGQ